MLIELDTDEPLELEIQKGKYNTAAFEVLRDTYSAGCYAESNVLKRGSFPNRVDGSEGKAIN